MNEKEFSALLLENGFPRDAVETLKRDYAALTGCQETRALLEGCAGAFRKGEKCSFTRTAEELRKYKEKTGVHPYASDLLTYIHEAPVLREKYRERGLKDELFTGVMDDLRCKLYECLAVFGLPGSFVSPWFARFFDFSLYALGRLEFCLIPCPVDYEKDGLKIGKGQPCIDVHIPSKGKLKREDLTAAYAEAAEFFAPRLEGPAVFHCESWLLNPDHRKMLPENSGILRFAADYDLIGTTRCEDDLWRIFANADTDRPETLPEDTALRRAYKRLLLDHQPFYGGIGLFFWERYTETPEKR